MSEIRHQFHPGGTEALKRSGDIRRFMDSQRAFKTNNGGQKNDVDSNNGRSRDDCR